MDLRNIIEARAAMEGAVRDYFNGEGFVDVATPAAVPHPNLDPNVYPIPVTIRDLEGNPHELWLHTSPELSMKKLLAKGSDNIYRIGPVFRDMEWTKQHRCEFSMLEWYRVDADYEEAMRDTIRVFRAACRAVTGEEKVTYQGILYDLDEPWDEMTMAEVFYTYAGIGSWEKEEIREALENMGHKVKGEKKLQDLFFQLYVDKVEPVLGVERPLIVRDYPAFLGTMARPRPDDQGILERFEVYIGGMELANGYSELIDAIELEKRMNSVLRDLEKEGIKNLSLDTGFLDAVADIPPCAGVSVGMDRLAMLMLDADDISQVVYPFEQTTT